LKNLSILPKILGNIANPWFNRFDPSSARRKGGAMLVRKPKALPKEALPQEPIADLDDPRLKPYEVRFGDLRRQYFRNSVDAVIEIGEILLAVKPLLTRQYAAWLERVGMSVQTAFNYEGMATLARTQPEVIRDWKELGPSKLYQLQRISERDRKKVLKAAKKDELLAMTDREFAEALAPYKPEPEREVTPAMKAGGFVNKVRSWRKQAQEFRTYLKRHKGEELPEALRAELKELRAVMDEVEGLV
jgi:hypothetical protein